MRSARRSSPRSRGSPSSPRRSTSRSGPTSPTSPPMPSAPDFIGVGALGSGTGWWHGLLLAHPAIRPPQGGPRALHHFDHFCATEMTDADLAAYHAHFPRVEG